MPAACSIPLVNYQFNTSLRPRFDEPVENEQLNTLSEFQLKALKKGEILKAASEFVTFADNGPSGMNR
jgi:hypothetical protein